MTEQFDGLEVPPGPASMDGLGLEHMGATEVPMGPRKPRNG